MMEVLRHSIVSAGSLGRLPNSNDPGGGGGGSVVDDSNSVGGGGSSHSTLNSPMSVPSDGSLTLRSPLDTAGGGGGAGLYSEPDELKSDDASSVASGFTSADSMPADPKNFTQNR